MNVKRVGYYIVIVAMILAVFVGLDAALYSNKDIARLSPDSTNRRCMNEFREAPGVRTPSGITQQCLTGGCVYNYNTNSDSWKLARVCQSNKCTTYGAGGDCKNSPLS